MALVEDFSCEILASIRTVEKMYQLTKDDRLTAIFLKQGEVFITMIKFFYILNTFFSPGD